MTKLDLNGRWDGMCYDEKGNIEFAFSGTVPGCAHTDLMGTKIDTDIFYRDNAEKCKWIENKDFKYTRTFTLDKTEKNAELVFEGLDVYADIYLNGTLLGSTDNMFISHRFNVKKLLKVGDNTLSVYFKSPIKMVEGKKPLIGAFTNERLHTRRIQCTYGWDWIGRFVTCGIFKDVYIEFEDKLAVDNIYIYTESISGNIPQICFEAEFKNFAKGDTVDLEIISPEGEIIHSHRYFVMEKELKDYIDLPSARLWYPIGYGEQPIYTLRLCGKEYKFGIRTVRVSQIKDEPGSEYYKKCLEVKNTDCGKLYDENEEFSGFLLSVNDVPIFCKGGNWVPSEPFPSAESDEKQTEILTLAAEAGVNMLRVWGGGIFEREHFYSECDRLGILVTQDFLMACGSYPEDDPYFIKQLRAESEYAALTLRNHPCLMWWSGDNENAVMGSDDSPKYPGRTAIHFGLAPVLMKLDPRRRFFASSPFGGKLYRSMTVGTTHGTNFLWHCYYPYINDGEMEDYKEYLGSFTSRFVAEEPVLGASSLTSLRRFMTDEDIFDTNDMWLYHTKDLPEQKVPNFYFMSNFARKVFGEFTDGKDRLFKNKYVQYEWARVTMENLRRNKGFCNGEIYWMWNDCWPAAAGWAFVDYYCQPKASFYSFKRAADKLLVSVSEENDKLNIHLCNDSLKDIKGELTLYIVQKDGISRLGRETVTACATKSGVACSLESGVLKEGALIVADFNSGDKCYRGFYRRGKLPLTPTDTVRIVERDDNSITVVADDYVHIVEFEGEFIFEDNYFSLMPGEVRKIPYRKARVHNNDDITLTAYTVVM